MASILLAEDDEALRGFLVQALERAGHEVAAHPDGVKALAALERGANDFDLLLTDIIMPGLDGIELAERAARLRPGLKIMFITGFAGAAATRGADEGPAPHLLSKPFHLKDLVENVEALLAA